MLDGLLKAAASVSTSWSLAAFAIAGIVHVFTKKHRQMRSMARTAIVAIVVVGLVPILGSIYVQLQQDKLKAEEGRRRDVYRLRVTVLHPRGTPVDESKVWSSLGGEPKKVAGGWQFDIPASYSGKVTVYASMESAFLRGQETIELARDFNPNVTIPLRRQAEVLVRGIVQDRKGRGVTGASVSIIGYGEESVVTDGTGSFKLPAHATDGQQVQLHAEKKGFKPVDQWHPAGDTPAVLVLGN